MEQKDFRQILKRYLSGGASEQEKRIVEDWYNEMGRRRGETSDTDEAKLEEQYLTNIMRHVEKSRQLITPMRTQGTGLGRYFVAIAASVLLLMVSLVVIKRTPENNATVADDVTPAPVWKHITNNSRVAQRYDLPDGSNVILQPSSLIKFSTLFNISMREVHLEGEAFFEVVHSKDKPFFVYAHDITTRVLGTSFTVRSFREDKQVMVVVKTGKVSVLTKSAAAPNVTDEIILTSNQEVIYDRAEKVVARRIVEKPEPIVSVAEMERMRFEEAPLKEILVAIEKIYGVRIEYDENKFSSCTLTTALSGGGLYNRMDIITSAIGAKYELKDDRIVIEGAGCNYRLKKITK
jgi:transmembrane sensor